MADINDVLPDERMPGTDDYSERLARRRQRSTLQVAADVRDRLAEVEARLAALEAKPTSNANLANRVQKLEARVSRAAKIVGWLISWLRQKAILPPKREVTGDGKRNVQGPPARQPGPGPT